MAGTFRHALSFENRNSDKLSVIGSGVTYVNTYQPAGRYYARLPNSAAQPGQVGRNVPSAQLADGAIIGVRVYFESWHDSNDWRFFSLGSGLSLEIEQSTKNLKVKDATTSVVQTITAPFSLSTWYDIEVHVGTWSATVGAFQVFINGTGQGQQTNQNLNSSGPAGWLCSAATNAAGGTICVIDPYCTDGAASANERMSYNDGNGTSWEVLALNAGSGATTGGDAPDAGTLADTQEITGNDSNFASYNGSAAAKSAYIRTNGTGTYTGPSGRSGVGATYGLTAVYRMSRVAPAAQTLAPDAIITQTNLSGSVADIDEPTGTPDTNWLTASGVPVFRCSFPTPSLPLHSSTSSRLTAVIRATGSDLNQRMPPDAIITQTNLSGALTAIDEDPDSPTNDWLTAISNNADSILITSFGTPSGVLKTGAGLQNFKIYARLTPNGSACTYNVYLRNSTGRVGSAIATGSLTSTSGQLITATWNASLISGADPTGADVRLEFEVIRSGGSPGARTSGEVDAVEWNAVSEHSLDYSLQLWESGGLKNPPTPVTGSIKPSAGNTTIQITFNAGHLTDASGAGVECYITQTNNPGSAYIEIGAVDFYAYPATGATTVDLQAGNNADGMTTIGAGVSSSTFDTNELAASSSASVVPTSGEFGQVGFARPVNFYSQFRLREMWLDLLHKPSSGRTGTLAATDGPDTAALSGKVTIQGSIAVTDGADTAAIVGDVIVAGSLAVTEAGADTFAATGTVTEPTATGTLAATETTVDSAALVGVVLVSGALAITESTQDALNAAGGVLVQGDLAGTDLSDSAALSGALLVQGALAATDTPDTAEINGGAVTFGTLAATEIGSDTAALSGDVLIQGTLAVSEPAPDVAALSGVVVVQGALAVTESTQDVLSASGNVIVQGDITGTDLSDSATLQGAVLVQGSLAATDAADTALITGGSISVGDLAATETGSDVAALSGDVVVKGALAVSDSADAAAAAGVVLVRGAVAATDGADGFAATAMALINGTLDASETGMDVAALLGIVPVQGVLIATDGADTAFIEGLRRVLEVAALDCERTEIGLQIEAQRTGINVERTDLRLNVIRMKP